MAITAVAATKIQSGTSSASTAVSASAGNSLIVGGAMFNSGAWAVTRSGDTFTTDSNGSNGSGDGSGIASAPNVGGGSVTCQISCAGGAGISGWAFEVGGLPTSAIRDATSPAVLTGSGTTPTTNSLTNVTASAIFIGAFGDDAGNTTVAAGAGWTNVVGGTTMAEPNGASLMVGGLEFKIVAATGGQTAPWTVGTSTTWTGTIAVYKGAGVVTNPDFNFTRSFRSPWRTALKALQTMHARISSPPWPQQAPAVAPVYPYVIARGRSIQGLRQRGHISSPAWPQQAAAVAPPLTFQQRARPIRGYIRRSRPAVPPVAPTPPVPVVISRRTLRTIPTRRGKLASFAPPQVVVPNPAYVFKTIATRRPPQLRRKGRVFMPALIPPVLVLLGVYESGGNMMGARLRRGIGFPD